MFDDDDDDVVPRFNDVDKYYFEEGNGDPVCFSVLPVKFDEIGEVACIDSKKGYLQGLADNGRHRVHTEVVAWRVELDYEQPKILVLSSEGKWIELLKPRKCYEKTVRSILITVQMLHFVRKWPRKQKRSLWDHLCEVFNKFDTKPAEYDLKKHHSIIKLFTEKDPTLMKSKILQMFTESTSRNIREGVGTKEPTVASSSGDEDDLDNDSDDDYNGNEENNDDDYSCVDDDTDDQGNGDDKSNDDYSCNDDGSDDDGDIGNDGDDDGGTDNLCGICDNGGKLLSCVGQCRRAFHPREKDGIDSNCESLGLTTAQLQEIDHYICKNCEYKQHQCFSCGDLEPSDGPNAKVFQCYKASCGHFYHPSCIAKLLEPDDTDGACKLEKKIAAGMSFTCPAHWCFKCGKMEDSTQIALWLAVCRRCPVSYHKKCLPRNISFEAKHGQIVRAWHMGDRIIMYCGHHEIVDSIGTPYRDIRLPSITEIDTIGAHCMDHTPSVAEIDRTSNLAKEKAKVTGKMNTDQGSAGTTEMSNKLCREEADQTQKEATSNSREHISRKGRDEKQAEENKNDAESGKEKETHKGENACGRDLIFVKEKIPGKESNRSGLTIGGITSGHVDGRSPEKHAYAKTTTSNRRVTHQDSESYADGSYAGKQELKNPQCNDTHKATEIHTSGDKSRMRHQHKEHATDCKVLNVEKNRGKSHMDAGRDVYYKVQDPQCLHNHTELDALPHKFTNRDLSSSSTSKGHSRHNDDQRPSKTRKFKSSDGRESGRAMGRNNMGVNSDRGYSPLDRRYPQKRSRVSSPEGRRMDYHNSDGDDDRRRLSHREGYFSDGNRRRLSRHEDYTGDGNRRRLGHREDYTSDRRWMFSRPEDYCSDGDVGRRLSPRQSESSPGNFSYVPRHGDRTRHGPPSYGGRHGPFMNPRELEHAHYAMKRRAVPLHNDPPNVEYDESDVKYDRYNLMDIAPVERYSCQEGSSGAYGPPTDAGMGEKVAFNAAGRFRDYEGGSDNGRRYRLNSEDGALVAGSVTDRYVPRLDRTNNPIRSQGGLRDAW